MACLLLVVTVELENLFCIYLMCHSKITHPTSSDTPTQYVYRVPDVKQLSYYLKDGGYNRGENYKEVIEICKEIR